ncbi:MAG: hypothetical protein GTN49_06050 [candidate division Zixibacteria bacterium]|nr:hypothetical protein [candidate division Zixibacteria bacterium]
MKTFLIVAGAGFAAAAAAGSLPNAGDEHVMRFGPLASGIFEIYSPPRYGSAELLAAGGGGAGFWAQYDRTWIGYAMRLGGAAFEASGARMSIDWNNEYYIYMNQGKLRPFIMISAGYGYVNSEISGNENRLPVSLSNGARWNAADSPLYYTFSGGGKIVVSGDNFEEGLWGVLRGTGYFPLTHTVALYAGLELAGGKRNYRFENEAGNSWRVNLDVGPSWAF